MSEYLIKSILACFLLAAGLGAFLTMAALTGRAEHKVPPEKLRKLHRVFGWAFAVLLVPLAYLGLDFLAERGDSLPLRGVLHFVLAEVLIGLVLLKIVFSRAYRQLVRYSPTLGLTISVLTLVIFLMTAGFLFLRGLEATEVTEAREAGIAAAETGASATAGPAAGERLFAQDCASCHRPAEGRKRGGPDLTGVLKKDALPASGRPATPANVREQILRPVGSMPAFTGLSEGELASLLAYLETI